MQNSNANTNTSDRTITTTEGADADAPIVIGVGDEITPQMVVRFMKCLAASPVHAFATAAGVLLSEQLVQATGAFSARAVHEFDLWGESQADGAKSTAHWLSAEAHLSRAEARAQLARGKTAKELPSFGEAWGQGTISGTHLDLIEKARSPELDEILSAHQEDLVARAQDQSPAEFSRDLSHFIQEHRPREAEDAYLAQGERRAVTLFPGLEGGFMGKTQLGPIGGQIVSDELERLCQELFEADWKEATERLGREPKMHELVRTDAQRRADALVEMAIRSASTPPGAQRPRPLFSVLVGFEQMKGAICELEYSRIPLPPGSLVPFFEVADFERAVLAPDNRVEVSKKSRFFTGATRRALEIRDQHCTYPGCDQPARWCEADHIVEFAKGGETTQENARLYCIFHHHERDRRPPPKEE